ncbi:Six-hairpin glycosidase [Neolentinus lepideus HHB14362 ss-1]|uniref:Six-hairpin glycosidase n=1 Tax=Neolentinus lepideus HHB14362 ss-1 TaxID=1314782 RepID=A0A165TQU8_9AGAM|nr:Six-hairpin glycosidase [Neolentinus lepideus HHB14362 ss-1]
MIRSLLALAIGAPAGVQTGLNNATTASVGSNLLESANTSWELGTAAEALTEFYWPSLSVFRASGFPPPTTLSSDEALDVIEIARNTVQTKSVQSLPLVEGDGAVGDPASLGVAVLLAAWTYGNDSDNPYWQAASNQLDYLLHVAPRTDDGAISHRTDQVQLWSDFVYMAPPFIAYFGMLQGGDSGLSQMQTAYQQCQLYRNYLKDDSGLWRHVALGSWQDNTHWGTGNGWAAAGMLRVLQTLSGSDQADALVDERNDLTTWIQEIVNATWSLQKENGTLYNTLDDDTSFADSSATALLASVTYRMAYITGDDTYLEAANRALALVEGSIDEDGWLTNTVDPYTFSSPTAPGSHSPEGQAFVLLLQSTWRDYWLAQLSQDVFDLAVNAGS